MATGLTSRSDVAVADTASSTTDEERVTGVRRLFDLARSARSPMVDGWRRNYYALRNKNTEASNQAIQWFTPTRIPEIFAICAMRVGWKMDADIDVSVTPHVPFGSQLQSFISERSQDMEAVLDASYHVNREDRELLLGLWDVEQYGTTIFKTTWDETLAGGSGDASVRRLDPWSFYPDPSAKDVLDGNFYLEVRTMSVQEIERRWPGKGKLFINGGFWDGADQAPTQLSPQGQGRFSPNPAALSPSTSPSWGAPGATRLKLLEAESVPVLECWYRDVDFETNAEGERVGVDRWYVTIIAGEHVLFHAPATDLWRHGGHPYDRYVPNDLGEFWGISMVELLAPTQAALRRVVNAVQQNIDLTGNPTLVRDRQSGTSRGTWAGNMPGQAIDKRVGTSVEWMAPPQTPTMVPEFIRFLLTRLEAVSGLSSIMKGDQPSGRPGENVIDVMQEAANVRIRLEQKGLEFALRGAFLKKAALVSEFYDTPRWVTMVGEEGVEMPKLLTGRHFYMPTPGGAPLEYSMAVTAGSDQYTSRKVKDDWALRLQTMGTIDLLTFHEMIGSPNPQEILRRMGLEAESILKMTDGPTNKQKARS